MAIDTACSSSLVAANLAFDSVSSSDGAQQDSVGGALVGGINMMLLGSTTAMFQAAGMLSPEGRCKTLDESADGYVRSEACAMALMLPVDHAMTLDNGGSSVGYAALLIGSAVNQDGRSSSLTAPNGPAQQRVMREALALSNKGTIEALQVRS